MVQEFTYLLTVSIILGVSVPGNATFSNGFFAFRDNRTCC